jgi:tight adherence protein B
MGIEIIAAIAAGIIGLLVLVFGVISIRSDRQTVIDERLGRYASEYGSSLAEATEAEGAFATQLTPTEQVREIIDQAVQEREFAKRWKIQLAQADLKITPGEFLLAHFASVIGTFLVGFLVLFGGNIIFSLMVAIFGFFIPRIYVARRTDKRKNAFEQQLPDNLQMWVNGLRSGYSVLQAIEAIAKEAAEPTATEFRRVVKEVQLGIPLDEALDHLLERMPGDDLDLVITAVNIQREVGGNLAEILEVISHTIRERIKLKGEIRVLTSQGRITGYIIGLLPVFLLMLMMVISRDYVMQMFENQLCGWPMLGCGATMISLGIASIGKIVDIQI